MTVEDIVFSDVVQPVGIMGLGEQVVPGSEASVTGWGKTGIDKPTSRVLKKAVMFVMDTNACNKTFGYGFSVASLCTFVTKNAFCLGDSGGPLVQNGKVIGVVSASAGCSQKYSYPDIYTKVFHFHDWIKSYM